MTAPVPLIDSRGLANNVLNWLVTGLLGFGAMWGYGFVQDSQIAHQALVEQDLRQEAQIAALEESIKHLGTAQQAGFATIGKSLDQVSHTIDAAHPRQ